MIQIIHWRAFLNPNNSANVGVQLQLANGQTITVPTTSPAEFTAVLALLQSPNLQFDPTGGHIVGWR
jgi:hypothetical protein